MFTPIPVQFLKAHCFLWTFFFTLFRLFSLTCLSKRTVRNHLNQFWHLHIFQDLWQKAQYIPIIGNVYLQREINFFRKCPNLWHIIWDWVVHSINIVMMMTKENDKAMVKSFCRSVKKGLTWISNYCDPNVTKRRK